MDGPTTRDEHAAAPPQPRNGAPKNRLMAAAHDVCARWVRVPISAQEA
jgi:hypothetical protein